METVSAEGVPTESVSLRVYLWLIIRCYRLIVP
jgi:hypothetical protein